MTNSVQIFCNTFNDTTNSSCGNNLSEIVKQYLIPGESDTKKKMNIVIYQMNSVFNSHFSLDPYAVLSYSLGEKKENQVWLKYTDRMEYFFEKASEKHPEYQHPYTIKCYNKVRNESHSLDHDHTMKIFEIILRMMKAREQSAGRMINRYE